MDYYEWFDPYECIERLTRAAQTAREDGRREVLRALEGDCQEGFRRRLQHAVEDCARAVAHDVFKPEMARDYQEAQRLEKLQEHAIRGIMYTVPLTAAFAHGGLSLELRSPVYADRDLAHPVINMEVRTVRPFQYVVRAEMRSHY